MSVSFFRTPLLRTLSVGVAALCIAHTPALADDPPPPGAQHFDFAAAWSRPAVPFTSFTALISKEHDPAVQQEVFCETFECGTWIGDEHSPADDFDLLGTLTFLEFIPLPGDLNVQSEQLSELDPSVLDHGIDGILVVERFLIAARLTTPAGYDKYVTGIAARTDIHFSAPETVDITAGIVYFPYEWETEAAAIEYAHFVYDVLQQAESQSAVFVDYQLGQVGSGVPGSNQHIVGQPVDSENPNITVPSLSELLAQCAEEYSEHVGPCKQAYSQSVSAAQHQFGATIAQENAKLRVAHRLNNPAADMAGGIGGGITSGGAAYAGARACAIIKAGVCKAPVAAVGAGTVGLTLTAVGGGAVVGFLGVRAIKDWQAIIDNKKAVAAAEALRDYEICSALGTLRACVAQGYYKFLECMGIDPFHPDILPIDINDIVFIPVPLDCPQATQPIFPMSLQFKHTSPQPSLKK